MTCPSGFEFLPRPFPYAREPFRLSPSERVAYEGRHFSIPAFGLLLDKRLFTPATSHPLDEQITLYINRDAGLVQTIEPRLNASGYEVATPHYADYILDLRSLLEDVLLLHASDSQYSFDDFFRAHMLRNRSVYDLASSSASGVSDLEYVHPAPASTVPVAPSSTSIPSNQIELGAQQFQDIDMDEIMWQPFTRPKSTEVGVRNLPIKPIFPAVLPGGGLPTFTDLDQTQYGLRARNVSNSGGVLITGDALIKDTSIKLLTGSGQIGAGEGDFVQTIPWSRFPADEQLNIYYETEAGVTCINASGRQSIYAIPTGLDTNQVYLLNVSDVGSSGQLVQHWPANYHATSGIDPNGKAHDGVHVVSRLLYSLDEISPAALPVGRSLINGKRIFGHYVSSDPSSRGQTVAGLLKYANGNSVFAYGGITNPIVSINNGTSQFEWASISNRFSPISWNRLITSALQPVRGIFGGPNSTNYEVGDIMASESEVLWRKYYTQFGAIDGIVCPGGDRAAGGERQVATIFYETHTYRQQTDSDGNFVWVELSPPNSPTFTTQNFNFFKDTYAVNNIFSFFLLRKRHHGFVNVNGKVYFQWSEPADFPRTNRFAAISDATRTTKLLPSTNHSVSTYVVGFFPSWQIRLAVTTNTQVTVPDRMLITPASSAVISIGASIPISLSQINAFGPATWDPDTGLNYLYFSLFDGRVFFAKMDTSFTIIHINEVETIDGIFSGRSAVLDI